MNRRELLTRTGTACLVGSLAGCSGGDGGDGDEGGTGGESDSPTATPTATATEDGLPPALQTAVDSKDAALGAYQTAVSEFENVDASGAYYPQDDPIEKKLSAMSDALENVSAEYQGEKIALRELGDYLGQAAALLERGEPAVSDLASVITSLVESGPASVGTKNALQRTKDAAGPLGNVDLTFENLASQVAGITANESVLPESELDGLVTTHEAVAGQVGELQTLQSGLAEYVAGVRAYQRGRTDLNSGREAEANDDTEQARQAYSNARQRFETAEGTLRSAHSTLDSASPETTRALADDISVLVCRSGAIADASAELAEAAKATLNQNEQRFEQKRGDASRTLRRCSSDAA